MTDDQRKQILETFNRNLELSAFRFVLIELKYFYCHHLVIYKSRRLVRNVSITTEVMFAMNVTEFAGWLCVCYDETKDILCLEQI